MSLIKTSVKTQRQSSQKPLQFFWKTVPRGQEGKVLVQVQSEGNAVGDWKEVRWRKDSDGIWLLLEDGIYGFDLQRLQDDEGRNSYWVAQRGTHHEWSEVVSSYGDEIASASQKGIQSKNYRVRAQMPGKIIRIPVQVGQLIQKDQPLMVMEAMKMENEIRASQSGKVSQIKVQEGQAVETGADLVLLEPI